MWFDAKPRDDQWSLPPPCSSRMKCRPDSWHTCQSSSTFEIRTNSGKSSRPSCGRRDTCRATASRIGDRWYALGGWLQRSEINLQFKSVGVRARGSSDCHAASAMILLNLDRFDNSKRIGPREIESHSTVFRNSFRLFAIRGFWLESTS